MMEAERPSTACDQRQTMFFGRLSHLFVSPLNTILNGAEYIQTSLDKGSPEQQQEAIRLSAQAIQNSARWLDRLAQNLLDLTALFSGSLQPSCGPMELCGPLSHLLKLSSPYAEQQGITLHWSRDEMPLQVFASADGALADRIVLNLLSNAIRFGKSGGNIWVTLEEMPGACRLSIRDDGMGISEQACQLMQDPFRELTAQTLQDGSGIGLFISNEFCKAMNWRLTVTGSAEGTEAAVVIPTGLPAVPDKIAMASGRMAEEVRRREQSVRVEKEMTALFGVLK